MNAKQRRFHEEALSRSTRYHRSEWPLIEILQIIEAEKIHKELGRPSLYKYARDFLNLTEPLAYAFSAVAKKALVLPALGRAIREQRLMVQKAARMTSVLTEDNVDELIEFAITCTTRELDEKRAELSPKKKRRSSKKPVRKNWVRFCIDLPKATMAKFERAVLLADKDDDDVLDLIIEDWLERHDPVRRADRAAKKKQSRKEQGQSSVSPASKLEPSENATDGDIPCTYKEGFESTPKRVPLTASERHAVFARDRGRCVFIDEKNNRCEETKWTEIHHVIEVSKGGTNHPSNLRTLCAHHHDLVHQLSFPIEGQYNWLPIVPAPLISP